MTEPSQVPVSKSLVLVNSACQVLTHVLNISVLFWLNQYLIKRLPTEEYALYPLVIVPLQFVPVLSNVLTGGLSRFTVEAYARGDDGRIRQIVSTMMPLMAIGSALILLLGAFFTWYAGPLLDIDADQVSSARHMLTLLFCGAAIKLLLSPLSVGPYVRQKFFLQSVVSLGTQILRLAILAVLLYGHSTRVTWVVLSTVVAETIGQFGTVLISKRLVPALGFSRAAIDWSSARRLTSFGVWNSVQQVSALIRRQADVFILTHLATKTDVASFYLGGLVFAQIQRATILALGPIAPPLVALHTRGDARSIASVYTRGGKWGLWVVGAIGPALIIYRSELVRLYVGAERYADYVDTATVLGILTLVPMVRFGNLMLGQIAAATEKVKKAALYGLFVQCTNLAITFWLVGHLGMGAVGSALATLIAACTIQPILNWRLGREIAGVDFTDWLRSTMLPGLMPALIASLAWIGLAALVAPKSWLGVGLCFLGGLTVYGLILVAFAFDQADRDDVRRLVGKIKKLLGMVFAS
ncbi:MAG: polysaccharide biosynthesis C-terminal domain-containing protein [Planctomycetes bacterium]|nr:polysaccharide biosynthesis C-terminal domain-containing protein [Planctomycetota bacterium]